MPTKIKRKKKKFLTVVGTRPQLIKLITDIPNNKIVWTGQHYDKEMVEVLKLPKFDYKLSESNLGRMLAILIPVIELEKPDYIIVYGDCRSTVAGAIAAHQCKIPLIHIEAGCRSGDMNMIEERNRILVDSMSDMLFAPGKDAAQNLIDEGIDPDKIHIAGATQLTTLVKMCPTTRYIEGDYDVLTLHRDFNVDDPKKLKQFFRVLGKNKDAIYFPVHPRTKKNLDKITLPDNIKLLPPVPYKKMIDMMGYANRIITDSGGLQVEAYCLGTPCITLREVTEWPETVREGWNVLVGDDDDKLLDALNRFGMGAKPYNTMAYGRGQAKKLIKDELLKL